MEVMLGDEYGWNPCPLARHALSKQLNISQASRFPFFGCLRHQIATANALYANANDLNKTSNCSSGRRNGAANGGSTISFIPKRRLLAGDSTLELRSLSPFRVTTQPSVTIIAYHHTRRTSLDSFVCSAIRPQFVCKTRRSEGARIPKQLRALFRPPTIHSSVFSVF